MPNPDDIRITLTQAEFDELLPLVFEYKKASRNLIQQLACKQPRPKNTTHLDRWERLDERIGRILGAAVDRHKQATRKVLSIDE